MAVAGCGSSPTPTPSAAALTPAAVSSVEASAGTPSTPGPTLLASPAPSPSPASAPSPSPPSSAAASPGAIALPGFTLDVIPSDTAAWSSIAWRRLSPDDPLGWVSSITHWPGGYVALGRQIGDSAGAGTAVTARTPAWVSTDGTTWTALDPAVFGPDTLILGVAAVPGGLAALTAQAGSNGCDPGDAFVDCFGASPPTRSWTSPDGLSWTPHPGPFDSAEVPSFGANGRTLFALTYGSRAFLGAVSTDGVTWTELPEDALPSSYAADSPAVFGTPNALLLAGGANLAGGGGTMRASIPRSVDGQHWTSARLPSTTPGVPETVGTIYMARDGLLADGSIPMTPGRDLWWRSADGAGWSSVTGYPPLGVQKSGEGAGNYPNGSLTADGARIIAYRDTDHAAAWASFDGKGWQRLTMSGDSPVRATFTVLPIGIVAVSEAGAWFGSPS